MKWIRIELEDEVADKIEAQGKREKRKRKTQIEHVLTVYANKIKTEG